MGKTTLIRDIARQLSDGFPGFPGVRLGLWMKDPRLPGVFKVFRKKVSGFRLMCWMPVLKQVGIRMMIRAMSPVVIITDEVGREEDVHAIEALNAGIRIITTAHSSSIDDALRPILSNLLKKKIFQRIIVLGNSLGVGTVEKVYDGYTLKNILTKPVR